MKYLSECCNKKTFLRASAYKDRRFCCECMKECDIHYVPKFEPEEFVKEDVKNQFWVYFWLFSLSVFLLSVSFYVIINFGI